MEITTTHQTPDLADPCVLSEGAALTRKGGQTCKKRPPYEAVCRSHISTSSSLADQTIGALQHFFNGRGHYPSTEMWAALRAVAVTMEEMAEGRCPDLIHVSSLDPGVGKTSAVVCFLKVLLGSSAHADVAALVCVQRKEQIEAIVKEAGLASNDYAVLTADSELNALGCGAPSEARVLFTTHKMVESRCMKRRFAKVAEFHYRGEPRAVRIWDEAILPGQTLTIRRDDLAGLLSHFRGRHPQLAGGIESLFTDVTRKEDGTVICLPDLADDHGVDLNDALALVAGHPKQELVVEGLWFLSGKHVTVRRDGLYGETILDYRDTLPDDIKPLLALDASARVRTVYDYWKKDRGGIVMLPDAPKSYHQLAIHVWERSGGKSAYRKEGLVLVEGVATTIMTRPQEEWLVVHHKADIDFDFEDELRRRFPVFAPRVHFLHWGAHDATNLFGHVPNIVLAGTLFVPKPYYESLGRLASAYPSSRGRYDEQRIKQVTLGEHRHMVLQALCRGAVRKCEGESCPSARAYIIASRRSGIADALPSIFPGAQVLPWRPVRKPLKGKVADALEFIVMELARTPWSPVTFRRVMDHIGWKDRKDFKRRIRRHPDFVDALEAEGIEEWGSGRHPRGFRRIAATVVKVAGTGVEQAPG